MSAPPNPHEIETIRAFVTPEKRDRYVGFVSNEERRKDFVLSLSHFGDFDQRRIVRVPKMSQTPAGVEQMLVARGASDKCHAISELRDLDGKEVGLTLALKEVIGRQMGTLLCCIPGRLAYFENEDDRFILEQTPKGAA